MLTSKIKVMILGMKKICLLLVFLSCILPSGAQKRKNVSKRNGRIVKADTKSPADILYESMLSSTAKIMIIDSVVTDKDKFIKAIPLDDASGKIGTLSDIMSDEPKQTVVGVGGLNVSPYAYINEFANKIFYSVEEKDSMFHLRYADKLGGEWIENRLEGDFGDELVNIAYPFMMPDGVTLYFSAESKSGLGGRDIYVTMYDPESARFYKPENIGLPYNSSGNDYYCIIDEFNTLGWLVTDRRQPEGKVCVYTFVPSASRELYDTEGADDKFMNSRAAISSIKDTWTDNAKLEAARSRLNSLVGRRADVADNSICFIVNDNVVYTDVSQFKSPSGREKFMALNDKRQQIVAVTSQLETLRLKYPQADRASRNRLSGEIRKMEQALEKVSVEAHDLEKEIRNTENLLLKGKR